MDPVNILMVDDAPGKLLSYEAMLAGLGENLIKAHSAREAMAALLQHDIAVILLDVSMPRSTASSSRNWCASIRAASRRRSSSCRRSTSPTSTS
jgi:CheY-like chemotaxis protein